MYNMNFLQETKKYDDDCVAMDANTGKFIKIKQKDYRCYYDNIKKLIKKHIDDEDFHKEAFDLIEDHKLPKNRFRVTIKNIIDHLDNKFDRYIGGSKRKFMKIPNLKTPDMMCVYGSQGSGKTWITAQYIRTYRKLDKDKKIFLFTSNQSDDDLYKGLDIQAFQINKDNIAELEGMNETTFENSIVVFDDIEVRDKNMREKIYQFRDSLFQKGRKHGVDIVNIIHKALDNSNTVVPNEENNGSFFFPRSNWSGAKRLLKTYFDLNIKQIDEIYRSRTESRWVYVSKSYPIVMIWEKGVRIIN